MFADRTLAWVGTALLLFGSMLSLISSQLVPFEGHKQLTLEALFLLGISGLGVILVALRLFKAMWLIIWLCIIVFIQCIAASVSIGLEVPGNSINQNNIYSFLEAQVLKNLTSLFQHHIGWPVIGAGNVVLVWVAYSVKGGFFRVTPRTNEEEESLLGPHAALIVRELADAPKWPLIWGTILILTGIIILFAGTDISLARKLVGALISELGFAFFIAFIIVVTIEIRTQSERDRQISQGIISYIYGINLDDEMFFSTEEFIFKTPFFRKDAEVTYSFMRHADGKFLLKYSCSYEVINVSRNVKEYPLNTTVEKSGSGRKQSESFPGVELGLQKIYLDGEELTEQEIEIARKSKHSIEESPDFIQSMYRIRLRPGESKKIMIVHHLEKWERDHELWRTVMPCSGVSLFVNWPESFNLSMRACAVHPSDAVSNSRNGFESKSSDAGSLTATLNRPFFPFNGVYLWWDVGPASGASSIPDIPPISDLTERIEMPTPAQALSEGNRGGTGAFVRAVGKVPGRLWRALTRG